MKIIFVSVLVLLLSFGVLSQDSDLTDSTVTTTEPTTVETTSTVPPETTATPTTTSSSQPPTTTSSTTAAPTTTSSTSAPTVAPTTSSPEPTPPPVEEGNWTISNGSAICIKANLKILFIIMTEDQKQYVALSPNASSQGSSCDNVNNTQLLVLYENNYSFTIMFEKDADKVYMRNITLLYGASEPREVFYNDEKHFSVGVGHSYKCRSEQKIDLKNATMVVKEIQVQAFMGAKSDEYGEVEECAADDAINDIVPIAVGCALLALIIIVLIAYLVGRRRSRQRGYQSV